MSETGIVRMEAVRPEWEKAFRAWQSGLAWNTCRAYVDAWEKLQAFTGLAPDAISRGDVTRWVERMRSQGLSAATIRLRLAAISSFYHYASFYQDGGSEPLFTGANPAAMPRMKWSQPSSARYLDAEECQALLQAIQKCTGLQAKRDFALFLAYLITGRRNSEIRLLQWKDLAKATGKTWYRWSGKGKREVRAELPAICDQAIQYYMQAAGRSPQPEDYVFTAVNDHAGRLPTGSDWQPGAPLSSREVGKLLKKYCVLAGLDPGPIHVHTLRHSAAMLRKAVGDDLGQIQGFLGHNQMATTMRYLHLEGSGDTSWGKVAGLLGLAPDESVAPTKRHYNKRR